MQKTGLERFISSVKKHWSGLNTETVEAVKQLLKDLTKSSIDEPWLKEIIDERPAAKELYRDAENGFILLVHSEDKGMYRQPHNHGAGWVLYAVQSGEIAINTFKQITTTNGETHLVSRGAEVITCGDCRVFLPGDIHDTKCLSDGFIQYRLTSTDFKKEIQEGRLIRFASSGK
jgi:hypothetical protein